MRKQAKASLARGMLEGRSQVFRKSDRGGANRQKRLSRRRAGGDTAHRIAATYLARDGRAVYAPRHAQPPTGPGTGPPTGRGLATCQGLTWPLVVSSVRLNVPSHRVGYGRTIRALCAWSPQTPETRHRVAYVTNVALRPEGTRDKHLTLPLLCLQ